MSAGGMGAIVASTPLEMALQITDWRGVYLFIGIVTIFVGVLIFFIVPEKRENSDNEKPLPISESQGPAHNPNIASPVPPAIPDNGPILQKA